MYLLLVRFGSVRFGSVLVFYVFCRLVVRELLFLFLVFKNRIISFFSLLLFFFSLLFLSLSIYSFLFSVSIPCLNGHFHDYIIEFLLASLWEIAFYSFYIIYTPFYSIDFMIYYVRFAVIDYLAQEKKTNNRNLFDLNKIESCSSFFYVYLNIISVDLFRNMCLIKYE